MAYQAEYIWLDGTEPTPLIRSKTKILGDGKQPPIWGFDGSSTNQATGEHSDCVLRPVFSCPDPLRGGTNVLVLCDVLNASDMKPHPTNTRAQTEKVAKKYAKDQMIYGIEQEYTMLKADGSPLGFPKDGFPEPQGPYYCGVGTGRVIGREIIEEHTQACIDAGLMIEGTNAEVMPGQWEFQIGAADALTVSDQLYVARWLLHRIAEDYDVIISFAAKPVKGDWNGAGVARSAFLAELDESCATTQLATQTINRQMEVRFIKASGRWDAPDREIVVSSFYMTTQIDDRR